MFAHDALILFLPALFHFLEFGLAHHRVETRAELARDTARAPDPMADETHRLRQILGADDDDRDDRDQQQFGGRDIEHSASLASPRPDRRAGGRFSEHRAASRRHGRRRDRRPFWSRYDHGHGLSAYRHP